MMKHTPIVLTLLCTSLAWHPASNATEGVKDDRFVLDTRPGQKLVLTDQGYAKAKALQELYDQQSNKRNISSSEPPESEPSKSINGDNALELEHTLGLSAKELKLAKSLHLSFEKQSEDQPTRVNPSLEAKSQPAKLSHPILREEDDDPELKLILLQSTLEYQAAQDKIAKEIREAKERKEAEEKQQAEKKRRIEEALSELKEVSELRNAQKESLALKINKLQAEKDDLKAVLSNPNNEWIPLNQEEGYKNWLEGKIKNLSEQINSLYNAISAFSSLDDQIHEETLHLTNGGDPRDLPWKEEVLRIYQSGASSLPSSSLDSPTPIPTKNPEKDSGSEHTLL